MTKDKNKKAEAKEEKVKVSGLKGGQKVKLVSTEPLPEPVEETEAKTEEKTETPKKRIRIRGKRYQEAKAKIDRNKLYSLKEAIALVKETSLSRFDGSVEIHIIVNEAGDVAEVELPYFKTKAKKIAIADEKTVKQIETGKIDFDILLASPKMMPKILPFARILGPKGLMPNPKNGTLVEDPEKALAKFSKSTIKVKTEKKAPVIHLVIGKVSQPEKELSDNIKALVKAIDPKRISKISLCATMGPGIKIEF